MNHHHGHTLRTAMRKNRKYARAYGAGLLKLARITNGLKGGHLRTADVFYLGMEGPPR